jgi:Outer membrane protein beta-barrel domain
LRKISLFLTLVLLMAFASTARAQQFDAAFGFGTVKAPAASTNGTNDFPSLSGGLYPSFSGIVLLKHHIGFGGEVAWRGSQSTYGGAINNFGIVQKYRPLFYDFNAVYGRTFPKQKIGADLMAGIGGEDLRFYTPYTTCGITCTNYVSSNHFAGHFGADVRFYFWGHAFIRPEAHYYVIHNNQEFNNVNASRFAVSIGYSFMPGF